MAIDSFLRRCSGHVCIHLSDGSVHTGRFRTDLLSPEALSAYFHGDERDISLPIHLIDRIDAVAA
jgi:hypothetical protein